MKTNDHPDIKLISRVAGLDISMRKQDSQVVCVTLVVLDYATMEVTILKCILCVVVIVAAGNNMRLFLWNVMIVLGLQTQESLYLIKSIPELRMGTWQVKNCVV